MIKLYYTPGCTGAKKAKLFFKKNNLEFVEKDITKLPLGLKEIRDIKLLSNQGYEDLISTNSYLFKKIGGNKILDLSTNEVDELIIKNPTILHRPIIIQYKSNDKPIRLMIGYNASEIEIFLRKDSEICYRVEERCLMCNESDMNHCTCKPKKKLNWLTQYE